MFHRCAAPLLEPVSQIHFSEAALGEKLVQTIFETVDPIRVAPTRGFTACHDSKITNGGFANIEDVCTGR